LRPHFEEALKIYQANGNLSTEQKEWFLYAAPRIVYEGINDKLLLQYIDGVRRIVTGGDQVQQ